MAEQSGAGTGGVTGTGSAGDKVGTIISGSGNFPGNGKAWNETPRGARLEQAYGSLHGTFQRHLPSVRHQLQTLAHRPIGGK